MSGSFSEKHPGETMSCSIFSYFNIFFTSYLGVLDLWTMLGPFLNVSKKIKLQNNYHSIQIGQSCNLCSHNNL